jgi:hypothetical protein
MARRGVPFFSFATSMELQQFPFAIEGKEGAELTGRDRFHHLFQRCFGSVA